LGLCLPPLLFCALDGVLTLAGQSELYWAGNYRAVDESFPTFNHLLRLHPAAFAAGLLVWAGVFVGLILLLPDTPALITSIAVTFGHTAGAGLWLLFRFESGYRACYSLFLLSAVVLGLGIRLGGRATPGRADRLADWPLRWPWVAVLLAAAVYLFLWPRVL
jgi:hypothetical protein